MSKRVPIRKPSGAKHQKRQACPLTTTQHDACCSSIGGQHSGNTEDETDFPCGFMPALSTSLAPEDKAILYKVTTDNFINC